MDARRPHVTGMARKSPLDDAQTAAFAWARWRRMMALVGLVTLVTITAALAFFRAQGEPLSIHFYIAAALGIGLTMLLGGALMSLVFLSSASGHDEAIRDD